ncbi:MAG: undecaprenyl-diphosphate phosphatase [Oscillospiraceae bacterium]|nr:undecaprenyl-diphosphate phosphatase [Oscillospiraceae bacterium]
MAVHIMPVFMAIFLGIVQGVAEFLPISSSGHLAVFQNLFNLNYYEEQHLLFDVVLHLGTLISIVVVYWKDIREMLRDGISYLRMKSDSNDDEPVVLKPPGRALLFVLIGTLPMALSMIFYNSISLLFANTFFIGFAFLITGGLLFVSSKYIKQGNKTDKTMTAVDALIIGLAQAVATLPGLSRSGTTIVVGLSRGLTGAFAVRFSLLLSIPAVLGATLVSFFKAVAAGFDLMQLPTYLAGFVVAAGLGYVMIQTLRRIMSKGNFGYFSYYLWALGLIVITWSLFRI